MGGPFNHSGCFVEEINHVAFETRSFCRIALQTAKIPAVLIFYLGIAPPPTPKEAWNELWVEEYILTVEGTLGPGVRLDTDGVIRKSGSSYD